MSIALSDRTGWIFDEEHALRRTLMDMVVSDYENKSRPVKVWFAHPDKELTEQDYPYLTIDLINIQEGLDRVHRGYYYTDGIADWWELPELTGNELYYLLEMPTPVDLDFQISTWARNPVHDRQILQQLITRSRTRLRAGGVLVENDQTYRRLDFQGLVKRGLTDENGKRLFSNAFRMRMSSQVPFGVIGDIGMGVSEVTTGVHLTINGHVQHEVLSTDEVRIGLAMVLAWDSDTRLADVQMQDGTVHTGVRCNRSIISLDVDDTVSIVEEFDPQRLKVLGKEYRTYQ